MKPKLNHQTKARNFLIRFNSKRIDNRIYLKPFDISETQIASRPKSQNKSSSVIKKNMIKLLTANGKGPANTYNGLMKVKSAQTNTCSDSNRMMPFMRGTLQSVKSYQQIGEKEYLSLKNHSMNSNGMIVNKLHSIKEPPLPSPADLLNEVLQKEKFKKFNHFKEDLEDAELRTVKGSYSGKSKGKEDIQKLKESKNTNTDFYSDSADDIEVSKPMKSVPTPSVFSRHTVRKTRK